MKAIVWIVEMLCCLMDVPRFGGGRAYGCSHCGEFFASNFAIRHHRCRKTIFLRKRA
jgi:hypothetical protein